MQPPVWSGRSVGSLHHACLPPTRPSLSSLDLCPLSGHTGSITGLVGYGANVEYETVKGDTPLLLAGKHGRVPAIITLLECGARIDGSNQTGFTALMNAAKHGQVRVCVLCVCVCVCVFSRRPRANPTFF